MFYHASPTWAGEARVFAALARGSSQRGHEVTFVCEPESAVEQRLDVGTYEVVALRRDAPAAMIALRLARVIRERFIEVVVVHSEREQWVAALAARVAGRAAVLRRVPAGEALVLGRRSRRALRLAATGFLFASADELRRVPVIRRSRLAPAVVPLGVDVRMYDMARRATRGVIGLGAGTRLLVAPYTPSGRKGAAHVLRVLALLAPRHPDLRLVLIGPGSDSEELRMHAAALRITQRVHFLGARDDELSLLALADLGWVVAGGDDGAYAALDLMGSRVPVLAERGTPAHGYVPDGIAGLLLPAGEPHEAAAAIARLLGHEEERVAMGHAGRARVARDHTEATMLDAFEQALAAAGDRSRW